MAPFYLGEQMKEFQITERGYFIDGIEQEIGSRHKFESLPAILVNKAIEVEQAEATETPRRGRPPKDSSEK